LRRELAGNGGKSGMPAAEVDDGATIDFGGRRVQLPPGIDAEKIRAIAEKRRSDAELTGEEQQLMRQVFSGAGGSGDGGRAGGRGQETDYRFGGDFWVVVEEAGGGRTRIVSVRTGLTDLDRVEIISGLTESERVLILPSAHLVETQEQLQQWITRRVGGVPGIGSSP